jgi:putative NADH-flavin reductase
MRVTVFGASGGTGRLLVQQAVDAGHEAVAVTRHPAAFPVTHPRLTVAEADVHDGAAVASAIEGSDAVLSSLGVPFTFKPVDVYSAGISAITSAMANLGVKRIAAVSSSAVAPYHHADGGFMLNRVVQPLMTATIGRSTYTDLRAMEGILRASGLDWTIVRANGLFDAAQVSVYQVSEGPLAGLFTSRADLAACLLAQVRDSRFIRRTIEITTSEQVPTLLQMIRHEAFKRS